MLPVYVEGLSRLRAQGVLQSIHINSVTREMEFQLRFLRAEPTPPDWSRSKRELSPKEQALLRQGWFLMYWKAFQKSQKEQSGKFHKTAFTIELSRILTETRNIDTRIDWSPTTGFTKRNF